MKLEVRQGRSHISRIPRGVGCEGQEKTCAVVCGPLPQDGQRSLGALHSAHPLQKTVEG